MADAEAIAREFFSDMGLPSLTDWYLTERAKGAEILTLYQESRKRPEYKQMYGIIDELRQQGAPVIPSEMDVRAYRQKVYEVGKLLPDGMLSDQGQADDMMRKGLSVDEIDTRVQKGYVEVALKAPPEVRAAFEDMYSGQGLKALAGFFLDHTIATPILEKQIAAAQIKGSGSMYGIDLSKQRAEEVAAYGVKGDDARKGMQSLGDQASLFTENAGETTDLSAQQEGVSAVFGLDATSARTIEQRRSQRKSDFSNTGGAVMTNTGIIGMGEAK